MVSYRGNGGGSAEDAYARSATKTEGGVPKTKGAKRRRATTACEEETDDQNLRLKVVTSALHDFAILGENL